MTMEDSDTPKSGLTDKPAGDGARALEAATADLTQSATKASVGAQAVADKLFGFGTKLEEVAHGVDQAASTRAKVMSDQIPPQPWCRIAALPESNPTGQVRGTFTSRCDVCGEPLEVQYTAQNIVHEIRSCVGPSAR